MKPVVYSRHALGRMRLYDISRNDVLQVLDKADQYEPSIKARINALREVNGRRLRVTYIEEEAQFVVITVTPLEK